MFLGEYLTSFSGRGRIILPKKFRQEIDGTELVLSRGFEECVLGFAPKQWEKETEQQLQSSITDHKARQLRRYLFSATEKVELDHQGRFVIPASLQAYAGLKEEVVIIGAGDHLEIWEPGRWKSTIQQIIKKEKDESY